MAPKEPADSTMWESFDALMAKIADAAEPYSLGVEVLGCLVNAITNSVDATSAYLIWASLTDRYELKVDERAEAQAEMRRAARDWLAVTYDPAAREQYLDHWRYEICGYER